MMDYLAEEVLERQPEEVRAFRCGPLFSSACAARYVMPCSRTRRSAADRAQQLSQSQAMLEKLERSNLFIVPLDNERRWYRYHHLFADLLRQRLHQSSRLVYRGCRRERGRITHTCQPMV